MSIRIFFVCVIVAVFSGIVIADDPNDLNYKPGELIVRFAPKANGKQRTKAERKDILNSIDGGSIKHSFKLVSGLTIVKLKDKDKVKDKIKAFKNKKGILYAEPNYKGMIISTIPNDPYISDDVNDPRNLLWGMHNISQTGGTSNADIDAPEAWDIATDAEDIIVAVIDTGVDYGHEDLAANIWVNQEELNGDPCFDDDGNGYIDDIYGYDFCTYGQQRDSNPDDDHGHGTHVSGTIGAVGNNGKGVVGVCWNVKIMALKWISSGGYGYVGDAIDCIEYAVDMGANVLSNSWRSFGEEFQALRDEIQAANEAGVLFIAAADNNGYDNDLNPSYPSSYELDNIISVMATDHNDVQRQL